MTDTKPTPSAENVERARKYLGGYRVTHFGHEHLAAEFAQSDAIARRRAFEEVQAILVLSLPWEERARRALSLVTEYLTRPSSALLRAPTSEKAEETKAKCGACGGSRWLSEYQPGGRLMTRRCPACSPPADGGGDG